MANRIMKPIDDLLHELSIRIEQRRRHYNKQCKEGGVDNQWNLWECCEEINNCNLAAEYELKTSNDCTRAREMYLRIAVLAFDAVAAMDEQLR